MQASPLERSMMAAMMIMRREQVGAARRHNDA
jgi:hypothetical protein